MREELTREQATQITDLDSYKTVTGAKRFKRTKEEMQSGLSPEEALQRRLAEVLGEAQDNDGPALSGGGGAVIGERRSRKGDMTIRLRPAAKTDVDYFEHVPGKPVELVLDQSWYSWFDSLATGPFEGDATKLLRYILEQGIGQVLTTFHFPSDIVEHERAIRTPQEVV